MKLIKLIFSYIKRLFYLLFARQRQFRQSLYSKQKIKNIIKGHPTLRNRKSRDKQYLKDCKNFMNKYFGGYTNTNWHHLFSTINGKKEVAYIPEDIYFAHLEPFFNKQKICSAYTDKNAAHFFIKKEYLTQTYFHIINGVFYSDKFNVIPKEVALEKLAHIDEKIVLKPAVQSGGGKDIFIKAGKGISQILNDEEPFNTKSFIVQEYIKQHSLLEQFHPSSVNSLRIMSALVNGKAVVLSSFLRMGRDNNIIDNGLAGGILCGISQKGKLKKVAYNHQLEEFEKHPNTGIQFDGITVPGIKEAWKFCKDTHKTLPHFTFISWDIAIDKNSKPVFIEYNLRSQGIIPHQLNNGPLFGEHTDYFLSLYKNRNKVSW